MSSVAETWIPAEPCCPECGSLGLRLVMPAEGATPERMTGQYACDVCAWTGYHFPEATLPPATVEERRARARDLAEGRAAGRRFFLRVNYSCFGDCDEHEEEIKEQVSEVVEDRVVNRRSGLHYVFLVLDSLPTRGQLDTLSGLHGVTRVELR